MKKREADFKHLHKPLLAVALLAVVAFGVLTAMVVTKDFLPFDKPVMNWVYDSRIPGLNLLAETITYLGEWETIAVIALLLFAFEKYRKDFGIPVLGVGIATVVINKIVKMLVARPRPEAAMMLISQGGYSYASGHSISSFAVYGLLVFLLMKHKPKNYRILSVICGLLAILIGLTRIYLGVHYPSDVLGGWLEAIAILCVSLVLLDKYEVPEPDLNKGTIE